MSKAAAWLNQMAEQLPNFTRCLEMLLEEFPFGAPIKDVFYHYRDHRFSYAPELDFNQFCFAVGMSAASFRTVIREPAHGTVIIQLAKSKVDWLITSLDGSISRLRYAQLCQLKTYVDGQVAERLGKLAMSDEPKDLEELEEYSKGKRTA